MASLNKAVNIDSMIKGGVELYIRSKWSVGTRIRVGALKDLSIEFGGETSDDAYHNLLIKSVTNGDKMTTEFTIHEHRPELLEVLFKGLETRRTLAGTAIVGETQITKSGNRGYEDDILLRISNANKTIASNITVTGSTNGLLTVTTSYLASVVGGKTVIRLIANAQITTLDQDITVSYNVTPSPQDIFVPFASGIAQPFVMELEYRGKKANGTDKSIDISIESCNGTMSYIGFIGDNDESTSPRAISITGTVISTNYVGFNTTP